jgi:hypothetical protein
MSGMVFQRHFPFFVVLRKLSLDSLDADLELPFLFVRFIYVTCIVQRAPNIPFAMPSVFVNPDVVSSLTNDPALGSRSSMLITVPSHDTTRAGGAELSASSEGFADFLCGHEPVAQFHLVHCQFVFEDDCDPQY